MQLYAEFRLNCYTCFAETEENDYKNSYLIVTADDKYIDEPDIFSDYIGDLFTDVTAGKITSNTLLFVSGIVDEAYPDENTFNSTYRFYLCEPTAKNFETAFEILGKDSRIIKIERVTDDLAIMPAPEQYTATEEETESGYLFNKILVYAKSEFNDDSRLFESYVGELFDKVQCQKFYGEKYEKCNKNSFNSFFIFTLTEPTKENVEKAIQILTEDSKVEKVYRNYLVSYDYLTTYSNVLCEDNLIGDVDLDGEITVSDARKILRIAIKSDSVFDLTAPLSNPEMAKILLDTDNDCEVTVTDARNVLRIAIRLDKKIIR